MAQAFKNLISNIDVKVIKNIVWLSADKIFRLLLSLVAGAWVARYLGPNAWGKLNYVLAYISIAVTVTTLGMDGFLIKEIVEKRENKNSILGTAIFLRIAATVVTFLINLLFFYITNATAETYKLFLFLYLCVIVTPFDVIDLEYQSNLKSRKTVIAKNVGYILGAILKISAVLMKLNLIFFAGILGVETVLAYLLLVIQYTRNGNALRFWKFDLSSVKHFTVTGWPFFLSGLAVILYMRLDQIMLGNMLTTDKVGEFSAAVKVSEMFLFIPMSVAGSFYPSLVEAKKNADAGFYHFKVNQLIKLMLLISVAICIVVTFCSPLIIKILYGHQFSNAAGVLQIYIWSLVAIFFGVAFSQYLVIENLQKFNFYRTAMGLVLNVSLNFYLIPLYGSSGAALATLASQFMSSIIGNFFFKKTRASMSLLKLLNLKSTNS